jgi:GH24 family phage-related lysozyme (muramidase)
MPVPPPPAAPGGRVTSHKVSASGVTLIKEFEGLPHGGRPYRDMVGVWTIGYGHTEGVGPNSRPLTPAQAADLLRHDLDERYGPPVNALRLPIGQHQFDALVSFVYNCGPGAVGSGTQVGRCLRAGQWSAAADALLAWNKAGGVAVAGLTRRRVAERALFLSEDDPMQDYTDNERRWIHEYDQLVRQGKDRPRRAALRRAMTEQRTTIWHSAQAKGDGGDGRGWEYHARRARYASLLARTS